MAIRTPPTGGTLAPPIQYTQTSDAVSIAYYAIGEGPPLIYLPGSGGLSHLTREWQYPEQRAWLERLAASRRLIRLDHRGFGLSDAEARFSLGDAALDIEAVARKERLGRFALFGQLHTAATAILYASQHSETVSHLVLWSPFGSYREFMESSPPLQAARAAAAKDWHTFTEIIGQQATGWDDPDQARSFAAYLRECATTGRHLPAMERYTNVDVTSQLGDLAMPVLVLHRREAAFPTLEVVRKVTSDAPGAQLVLLEGASALPFLGDTDAALSAIDAFLGNPGAGQRSDGLTPRETEILTLLAGGQSNEQIARALSISTRTVERHIGNIYRKIDAHNRAEATAYAFRSGLVTPA
jgi:pimeloyl-ACP methyl ester carboxylesterase